MKNRIDFCYSELCWRYYDSSWEEEDWLHFIQETKRYVERLNQDVDKYKADSWYGWRLAFETAMYEVIKDITFSQLCDIFNNEDYDDSFTYADPKTNEPQIGYWLDEVRDAMREDSWNADCEFGDSVDSDFEITAVIKGEDND